MAQFDTLLHISSETETTLRSINNFLVYFLLWIGGNGGGAGTQPSFMSMNQLAKTDVYDNGIAKYHLQNIANGFEPRDLNNYRDHYIQGYWETKSEGDYSAVSLKVAYPVGATVKLKGSNGNWCFVTKFQRYTDSKQFYFIQMTQVFNDYLNPYSYRGLSELLQYIKAEFPGLYIITGDFNVQGHEKVFEHFLGSAKYHICPFYKTATCNDNEGVGSPDGLVVSRELYPRVEYAVDFYPGYSYQHFMVSAKLYPTTREPGTFDVTDKAFKNFLQILKHKHGKRDYFVGNSGIFLKNDPEYLGSAANVQEVPISSKGPKTFTAEEMTKSIS